MKLHAFSKVNLSLYLPIDQYITLIDLSSHVMLFPFQYLIHILYRCSFLTFSWRSISPIIGTYFQIQTLCCDYYLIYIWKKKYEMGGRGEMENGGAAHITQKYKLVGWWPMGLWLGPILDLTIGCMLFRQVHGICLCIKQLYNMSPTLCPLGQPHVLELSSKSMWT